MKVLRFSPIAIVLVYACGGSDQSGLLDSGGEDVTTADVKSDNTVPPSDSGNDVTQTDGSTGDASDGGIIEAGPLCLSTPCITQIAAGGFHACARVTDGTVRCWGRNNVGQLGVGVTSDGGFDPTPHPAPVNPQLAGVSQITASHYSINASVTCVLANGVPECFGANTTGQLGLAADAGVFDNGAHPDASAVQGLPQSVSGIWAGNLHSCAIDGTGVMYCWGYDGQTQLGRPAPGNANVLPAGAVPTDAGAASQMGPGLDYTIGLTKSGLVYSWGANNLGQLGRAANDPSPPGVITLTNVTNIAAGLEHACAVASGAVSCWGDDSNGQLGDGKTGGQSQTPVAVNVASKTITQVTAGYSHTCALASDGTVYCWGQNDWGQCGTGLADGGFNNADVLAPTQVQGLTGKALQVEAGTNHACALIEGGSVMCWGANDRGQLGQGLLDASLDTNPHPTPVTVKFQ